MPSFKVLDDTDNSKRGTDALLQPGTLSPDSQQPSAATSTPASPSSTAIQTTGNIANTKGQPTAPASAQSAGGNNTQPTFNALYNANKNVDVKSAGVQTAVDNASNIQALQTSQAAAYQPPPVDNWDSVNNYVERGTGAPPPRPTDVQKFAPDTSSKDASAKLDSYSQNAANNSTAGMNSLDAMFAQQNPNAVKDSQDAQNKIAGAKQAIADAQDGADKRYAAAQSTTAANEALINQNLQGEAGQLKSAAQSPYDTARTHAIEDAATGEAAKVDQAIAALKTSPLNDATKAAQLARLQQLKNSINFSNVSVTGLPDVTQYIDPTQVDKYNRIEALLGGQSAASGGKFTANYDGDKDVAKQLTDISGINVPTPETPPTTPPTNIPTPTNTIPGEKPPPTTETGKTPRAGMSAATVNAADEQKAQDTLFGQIKTQSLPQLAATYATALKTGDTTAVSRLEHVLKERLNVNSGDLAAFPEFQAIYGTAQSVPTGGKGGSSSAHTLSPLPATEKPPQNSPNGGGKGGSTLSLQSIAPAPAAPAPVNNIAKNVNAALAKPTPTPTNQELIDHWKSIGLDQTNPHLFKILTGM